MNNIVKKHEIAILVAAVVISFIAFNLAPAVSGARSDSSKHSAISDVQVSYITPSTAIVTWTTNFPTTGLVYFDLVRKNMQNGTGGSNMPVTSHAAVLRNLLPNSTYYYYVDIVHAGKGLLRSKVSSFTTLPPDQGDTTPPRAPVVSSLGVSESEVRISWSGAQDESGIGSYTVFRDGRGIASLNGVASEHVDSVTPGTMHAYFVRVTDAYGNFVDSATVVGTPMGVLTEQSTQ